VAVLASRGETATEIASHLFVSKRTVESHLVSIYQKLGVGSKTELIRRASELGI
jgi:DNA-binding NarL/FixJ family response regulator